LPSTTTKAHTQGNATRAAERSLVFDSTVVVSPATKSKRLNLSAFARQLKSLTKKRERHSGEGERRRIRQCSTKKAAPKVQEEESGRPRKTERERPHDVRLNGQVQKHRRTV